MPVFDFNNKPDKNSHGKCTYTMVFSNASEASAESPILLLDNRFASGSIIPVVFLPIL